MRKVFTVLSIFLILILCFPTITFANDKEKLLPTVTEKKEDIPKKKLNLSQNEKKILYEKAENYNISLEGLTDEEIDQQVIAKENKEKIDKAKQAGIDTEGLTFEQVNNEINEYEIKMEIIYEEDEKSFILTEANKYKIDISGLSYESIKEMVYEKMMPELIEKAQKLGIDSKNLSYDELLTKVKEFEVNESLNPTKK